ncbi:MAG: hypothetical protein KGI80_03985 [Verrucomicrobiota bacterium]|nr:hypothetical protein [Verrucomicrobiota bacterium]
MTTPAITVAPGALIFQALSQIVDLNSEQMQIFNQLAIEYAKVAGGINSDGEFGKNGGLYGLQLKEGLSAASDSAKALFSQAEGALGQGIASMVGAGVTGGHWGFGGSMFSDTEEMGNVKALQKTLSSTKPATLELTGSTGETTAAAEAKEATETIGKFREFLGKWGKENNNSWDNFAKSMRKQFSKGKVAVEKESEDHLMKMLTNPTTRAQIEEHAATILREGEALLSRNSNRFTALSQGLIQPATGGAGSLALNQAQIKQAKAQGAATAAQAILDIIKGTVQQITGDQGSQAQKASGFGSSATQVAEGMAQAMRF